MCFSTSLPCQSQAGVITEVGKHMTPQLIGKEATCIDYCSGIQHQPIDQPLKQSQKPVHNFIQSM